MIENTPNLVNYDVTYYDIACPVSTLCNVGILEGLNDVCLIQYILVIQITNK